MYDEIVSRYYNVILNYCKYKLNGNKTAAEDITQEVFFVLYKKRNHLKMGDNIKLWLYRAADNQIKAYIRKNPSFQPIDELSELAAVSEISEITDSAFDFLTPEELALITEYYDGDKIVGVEVEMVCHFFGGLVADRNIEISACDRRGGFHDVPVAVVGFGDDFFGLALGAGR